MEVKHYKLIAEALLRQEEPVSLEKLAIITNLPKSEVEKVIKDFDSLDFLRNKNNLKKIALNDKARGKKP